MSTANEQYQRMGTTTDPLFGQVDRSTTDLLNRLSESLYPEPRGYKILVRPFKRQQKGLIALPETAAEEHGTASIVAQVIAMGSDAYADRDKFPNGPWCRIGDWIVNRSYTGTRMKIDGTEYRLINDDTVEAVVQDPEKVDRG